MIMLFFAILRVGQLAGDIATSWMEVRLISVQNDMASVTVAGPLLTEASPSLYHLLQLVGGSTITRRILLV
jgi:hypothetical protein